MKAYQGLRDINPLAVAAVLGFVVCLPLLAYGYPQGHDWLFELVRVVEYKEALSGGQGLPFWAGDLYRGFGSPIFVFYAPLYSACSALLMLTGLTLTAAAIATLVIFSVIGAVGVAGLAWELIGHAQPRAAAAARMASAAFMLNPYVLADMLIRNASAEYIALCISPIPFWGLVLMRRGDRRGLPLLTVSFAAVILAHNLTGLLLAAVLSITIAVVFLSTRHAQHLAQATGGLLLSLGLSCWFWLPALTLKRNVSIGEMLLGKFDFHQNFTQLSDVFGYHGQFALGWLSPAIMGLGIGSLALVRTSNHRLLGWLSALGVCFIFLQLPASEWVWEHTPYLPLFQFPWRMLGPFALVVALMTGLLFHRHLVDKRFAGGIVVLLFALNALPLMTRFQALTPPNQRFVSTTLNANGIRQRNLPATVLDEYLPRTANKELSDRAPVGAVVVPMETTLERTVVRHAGDRSMQLDLEADGQAEIHLARWNFPGWRASLDGVDTPVLSGRSGEILVQIPPGRHRLNVWLSQPAARRWGLLISGFSMVMFALAWFAQGRATADWRRRRRVQPQ